MQISFQDDINKQLLEKLYEKNIHSLIVEGGAKLINSFVEKKLWDEARIFTAPVFFIEGVKAPILHNKKCQTFFLKEDRLDIFLSNKRYQKLNGIKQILL